jgi:hypothetical protein
MDLVILLIEEIWLMNFKLTLKYLHSFYQQELEGWELL